MRSKAATEITSLMANIDSVVQLELRSSLDEIESAIDRLTQMEKTGVLSQIERTSVRDSLVGLRNALNLVRIARDERDNSIKAREERKPPIMLEGPKSETVVRMSPKKNSASA